MVSPRSISIWNPSKVFLIFYFARNLRERILLCGNFYDRFHWHSFIMSYLFNVWMGYSFVKFFVFTNVTQMKMFALFFPIILLLIFLYIIYYFFFCPFFSPDDVQSIISGKLALRYSGAQVSKILILLCLTLINCQWNITMTISEQGCH